MTRSTSTSSYPLAAAMLTRDEELQLARLARAGDKAALDRMVRAHLPLAYSIAWKYRAHGVAMEDLSSEAMLGLVKAAGDFDPERGVRLAGYAAMWIHAYLRRFTLENRRIVRGPSTRNARRIVAGLRRVERDLQRHHGSQPEAEAIARALNVTPAEVDEIRSVLGARDVVAGDAAEGHRELSSYDPGPEAFAAADERRRLTSELVSSALARLEPRMRTVLARRYLADSSATLTEIGRDLGVSRERARQIEVSACARLKAAVSRALSARSMSIDELSAA